MPAKFPNNTTSRHIPVEHLPIASARGELRIIPVSNKIKISKHTHTEHVKGSKKIYQKPQKSTRIGSVPCDMDIADFTAVRFVGLDVQSTVGIPQAYGAVFAAAKYILAVGVESRRQHRPFVPPEHVRLLPR